MCKTPVNGHYRGMETMGSAAVVFLLLLAFSGCSPARKVSRYLKREFRAETQSNQFTGLLLVDARTRDTLYALNPEKYFTPASNVKLFTFYAALKTLPQHIPALKYARLGDTLYVVGTGDPAALHPDLRDSTALRFMRGFPEITMVNTNLADPTYGPGWSWDDFDQYYMPGRSAFPIHGNILRLTATSDGVRAEPAVFGDSLLAGSGSRLQIENGSRLRAETRNLFYQVPESGDTLDIPIRVSPGLERQLWSEATGSRIHEGRHLPPDSLESLPGMAVDTLLKKMMAESDNFIAEQLMLAVSGTRSDTLSFRSARDFVLEEYLPGLPQKPRWVDGSGLSRYNLFTPESVVYLLGKLYREFPEARLFALLAQGGRNGTIEDYYRDGEAPYLFGKTGSLGNNHNLSGYLRTRSGKLVLFAFMNNHFTEPSGNVKNRMQRILREVRDTY
ncbi:D-alanyl-D-alanine carboxypeptidase/D-alanyl-D-alanine-endopeptidase [Robiginitalea sp. SC105]|uniref:D-alanyl-D-alanine carboxypeptidase/D-alanyl-D-alanine-endopeptidase n=1 Tax=Robiginitalea sp. SC105 TaxID=2762332 RepID=UPI00163A115B|nr:D-alanyl-D-alanine carboxypeptidase [Robiginitalea sp. SC105]MBC2839359.1 D-alanyl-D-alanine carboxypeptidase [Robiginitalea sp. SC105]